MTSTFDPTLQHLETIDRCERALGRMRALPIGKILRPARVLEASGFTKNGMLAEIHKN